MAKITEYLEILFEGKDLTFEQAQKLLDTIFEGEVAEVQIAAFLAAMRVKRASVGEIAGLAKSLRNHSVKVKPGIDNLVDTCGTGGSKCKTFNVSTASAFTAAGAGVYIAKHGNRGITSKCGSADVLMELGVKIDASVEIIEECIREAHIGFMFAPKFHPAMKHVQHIRQSLDFRTAFNILGPLANPAGATAQVMGVYEEALMERIANVLKVLGSKRAMVVHSEGLDEINTMDKTKIVELKDGNLKEMLLDPQEYGIKRAKLEDLKGGDAAANAKIVKDILTGKEIGAKKDMVLVNAAAAIMVGGLAADFAEGLKLAEKAITGGKALASLEKLVEISNKG